MNRIIVSNSLIKKELYLNESKLSSVTLTNLTVGNTLESSGEEFILTFKTGFMKTSVKASSLKVTDFSSAKEEGVVRYTVSFEPFNIKDSRIAVRLIYLLNDSCCYIRKYVELEYDKKGSKEIILDCIAFESFDFDQSLKFWTLPEQKNSVISGFALSMGQPFYIDCFYFGCEFPTAINKIEKGVASSVYYSGKSLCELIGGNVYTSHKSVVGGACSDIFEDVQKAFYEYIKDISKPVYFRRQYNSWYDNMLNITRENITSSFLEIEKKMTECGEPALDSYVADDGWNDYAGPFWGFNSKFPDELYPFKNLAEALGSKFGLWLGPRGGYTDDTIKFARKIQAAGNGYVNKKSMDICVGSKKYTEKTTDLLCDYRNRFNLNYYKLDGFAQRPCKCKKHDHLTGGYKDTYFYTDIWERWIGSFEKLASAGDSDFWINLTCYAWPSPWFLQWVNSVWMQISLDHGFIGKKGVVSDKDRLLSYRDDVYLDFYRVRQFQFPQRALYNHDPVFGKEVKISMTDDEFREYLFTMATRGTQFWELYYSHSIMNDAKWRINYSCMRFIEENMDVLANSVIFGGRPSDGAVYGYSCFADKEGIVSLRNSSGKKQEYTLKLDELIGVSKSFESAEMYTVIPYRICGSEGTYSYGDSLTFTLEPYQTRIVHFGKKEKKLAVSYCRALSDRKLLVTFNQLVNISDAFSTENKIIGKELLEDYMSVVFDFENPFNKDNALQICGVMGATGVFSDVAAEFTYYENGLITDGCVKGKSDFSVVINLGDQKEGVLYRQGEELEISVGDDGFVRFRVGEDTLRSSSKASDAHMITAVRERNNVLKLYFDRTLDSGLKGSELTLSGCKGDFSEGVDVKIYNRALAYDEV